MILVVIFLAFTISLQCHVTANFLCHTYDESSKSLGIYCDNYQQQQQQLPTNCAHNEPSFGPLQVVHLKIERCDQSIIGNASEKYPIIESLDISYSGYISLGWTGSAFKNVVNFNASSLKLLAIPAPILSQFPNLEQIDLSHNSIVRIFSGSFKNCPKLKQMNLSNNRLKSIAPDAFNNLSELSEINLAHNQFTTFPAAIFTKSIKQIDMRGNLLSSTIDCAFISAIDTKIVNFSWDSVKTFEIDQNCSKWKFTVETSEIEGISAGIDNRVTKLRCHQPCFENLQSFVAGPNVFENVSDVLSRFKPMSLSVRKIDLSGNNVGDINLNTFLPFQNLHELSLGNTGLKEFAFNWMSKYQEDFLSHLDISDNDLKAVKNAHLLRNLGNLKYFNAAGNQIQNTNEIAQHIRTTVEQLNLAGNNVGNADEFRRLTALKHLNLSDSNLLITDADVELFRPLRQLISLDVSRNNLSNVNFAAFLNAAYQLQDFRASNCQMENLSDIIQYFKPSVEILDLSGNHIGPIVNASLFQTLTNLTHLNLSATNLQKFDFEIIKPLKSLQTLDISHNHVQSIDLVALSNFKQLDRLYLNDNDLTKLDHYNWNESPNVSLAIAKNHFSCIDLKRMRHEMPKLKYIGNQLDQKHGDDCLSNTQAIGDFLDSVYDNVKFW